MELVLSKAHYIYLRVLLPKAVHKKSLFPVKRVAIIVAGRAAADIFSPFFFLGGGGGGGGLQK